MLEATFLKSFLLDSLLTFGTLFHVCYLCSNSKKKEEEEKEVLQSLLTWLQERPGSTPQCSRAVEGRWWQPGLRHGFLRGTGPLRPSPLSQTPSGLPGGRLTQFFD